MNYPISIREILQNNFAKKSTILSKIRKKTIFLIKINKEIHKFFLLVPLCFWFRIANIKEDILIIEVLNASWKTYFNFKKEKLLIMLRSKYLPKLQLIKVKINPNVIDIF